MNFGGQPESFHELIYFFGPRIAMAILCGGIVGIERELKHKAAGLKTNIMICLGSTLFTSVSIMLATAFVGEGYHGDPARIAAQIVSGIGFIGGGAIIKGSGTIIGLTTAATIWLVAAIGVCVGIGHYMAAVATSLIVVISLFASNFFEDRVLGRSLHFSCEVVADDPKGELRRDINQILAKNNLVLEDFDMSTRGQQSVLVLRYSGHRSDHKKFVLDLWSTGGISEVKQL